MYDDRDPGTELILVTFPGELSQKPQFISLVVLWTVVGVITWILCVCAG